MEFLKTIGGRVATGVVSLAVVAGAISWWRMDESTKHTLLSGTGRIVGWLGIVLVVPWAAFFLIGWVGKRESNGAGAALVAGFTVIEAVLLGWLFNWSVRGAMPWTFFIAATLLAGVYNLFACDWIAEKAA